MRTVIELARSVAGSTLDLLGPKSRHSLKERFELRYWKKVHEPIDELPPEARQAKLMQEREHYEYFFTEFFGLTRSQYVGKSILDIGCGPMGSLEWADQAAKRVGLDPLAADYLRLGAAAHRMEYVTAASEDIPFPDGTFDFVTSFNSLDHVADVVKTVGEMKRVTASGGIILIVTEVEHVPRMTQPNRLHRSLTDLFSPEFLIASARMFGIRPDHDVYASLSAAIPHEAGQPGMFCVKMKKLL